MTKNSIPRQALHKFVDLAKKHGFVPRIGDVVGFAKKSHVILLRHKESDINVDLSLGFLPFEYEAIKRSKILKIEGVKLHLPTAEDLIIMKAVAHRPKDMEDIRSLVESNCGLDVKRIKFWVTEFAKTLEMPDIWNEVEVILKNRQIKHV